MIRSIYTKIFLWFWIATIGVTASVVIITLATGAQPLGHRWMSRTLDFYARSAVDFYEHGGKLSLQHYFDDIEQHSGIRAALLDPHSKDILDRGLPPFSERVLAEARSTHQSQFHIGLRWTGAAVVPRTTGDYILVAQVLPLRDLFNPAAVTTFLIRAAIALLSAGFLSLLFARHFAAPIRALQVAAGRIADGDLTVRATPALAPRNDELADLAKDFDVMAERIQNLIQKQHELLGDISHELRSPLARIGVSLELVRRGDTDGIDRMQTDLDRIDGLIGQILSLTRLQSPDSQKSETPVNLRPLIEAVAADARFECHKQDKSVMIARSVDCWVNGDPSLFRSCIENVVRNAVRYTKPNTEVTISLAAVNLNGSASPSAQVLITDHGEGVPPSALPHLFEAFYRVSESRDRDSGGTGLGLSIAQRVVIFHGGSITARNIDSGGLEVAIYLPMRSFA